MKLKEISLKGFEHYKFEQDGKVWYEISDVMSEKELKKCIQKTLLKHKTISLYTTYYYSCYGNKMYKVWLWMGNKIRNDFC